jgi:endonuclease/exonuclease/phosphatase family metal-dependent hydrolase
MRTAHSGHLRIVTYNAHGCVGTDGARSIERIADVLRACDADVIGLQEIDVGRTRSGGIDQAEAIAVRLGMNHVFGAALYDGKGCYGNALLAHRPIAHVRTAKLPTWRAVSEPRCFVHAKIDIDGLDLDVIVTHFGLGPVERYGQARHVAAEVARTSPRAVLLGDLNCGRGSFSYHRVSTMLRDAQQEARPGGVLATYPSWRPWLRLDHVFVGPALEVLAAEVPESALARVASDHLPVIVTLRAVETPDTRVGRAHARPG